MDRKVILKKLYSPEGTPNIDIVLVHGVNGHPLKTWKDADSNTLWPKHWLPKVFPQGRVFSFGYNADMYRNNSAAGIRDNARTLLSYVESERDSRHSPTIVFIAHCLGGLIVKQALYFAEYDPDYRDAGINIKTELIVFFGTPNQGTHEDNWNHIAKPYTVLDKRAAITNTLLRDSHELSEINAKFRQLSYDYEITNFYENGALGPNSKLIVEATAAQIGVGHEKLRAVNDNHVAMCQFRSGDNSSSEEDGTDSEDSADGDDDLDHGLRNFRILCQDIEKATIIQPNLDALDELSAARGMKAARKEQEKEMSRVTEVSEVPATALNRMFDDALVTTDEGIVARSTANNIAGLTISSSSRQERYEEVPRGSGDQAFDGRRRYPTKEEEGVFVSDTIQVTATRTTTKKYHVAGGQQGGGIEPKNHSSSPSPPMIEDGRVRQDGIAARGIGAKVFSFLSLPRRE
ncbi:hypothetical protein B0T26DRAFT_746020 [Lasiosphaeria miniovina]|uniref:DUF676 domain-containing protein n=1 Tax=Lasiosphaeria miniovina TaxID=1954250 RepID=A0AA40BH01_9PEZI|nr:uncharacterized protein B0T26DRAFT_746020 [Lasiosphaeria miniovina]KAK0734065.1 hypothetical protein B0T26DRAFT_746020 [Lasiosphaeria miniovina]